MFLERVISRALFFERAILREYNITNRESRESMYYQEGRYYQESRYIIKRVGIVMGVLSVEHPQESIIERVFSREITP